MKHNGNELRIETSTYANGRHAIKLYDEEDGMPYATASINMPAEDLEDDEVIIKDYSENAGILDSLVEAGVVSEPIRHIQAGFTFVPVVKLLDA